MRTVRLSPDEASAKAAELLLIYRDAWVHSIPDDEHNVSAEDIQSDFQDFDAKKVQWEAMLGDPSRAVWVAQNKSSVVGFSVGLKTPLKQELEFAFVAPDWQGKGVGRGLIVDALAWLDDSRPIEVEAAKYNTRARRIYERLGFAPSDKLVDDRTLANGKRLPWITLIKSPSK